MVATGGLSIPKMGATPFGYELARQFGLKVVEPRPALVAFTLNPVDTKRFCDLTGSLNRGGGEHWQAELPGEDADHPSRLQRAGDSADLLLLAAGRDGDAGSGAGEAGVWPLLAAGARRDAVAAGAALREVLPIRLAERWLELHPIKKWTNAALEEAERLLHHFAFVPAGTEGFAKAEVTAGGVDTDELSAQTMEAKRKFRDCISWAKWWT